MKYDEINNDIINCLKTIEKIVEIFNFDTNSNKNDEFENEKLNQISDNFKSILDNLNNYMTIKQDEYNILLKEKETEIEKLKMNYNGNNADDFSNGLKAAKFCDTKVNKTFEYTTREKNSNNFRTSKQKQSNNIFNVYKANDFNFCTNGNKNKYKSILDIF